jgi:hypothetical protein
MMIPAVEIGFKRLPESPARVALEGRQYSSHCCDFVVCGFMRAMLGNMSGQFIGFGGLNISRI